MSHSSELADLIAQHRELEKQLADALSHPASTDAEIASIKRKKLKIKDAIMSRERAAPMAA